jgi:pimeloyl-ACP methyl ester carboxylesterase
MEGPMTIDDITLPAADGFAFAAAVAGPADGPLVLLLHGYPQSRHSWRHQLPALAAAGYRAVAPDQRGYSPGARPDPADLDNYRYDRLVGDALAIAAAAGCRDGRFHLVGHDWGGQVAWGVAYRHPERLRSLAVLSRPHPQAFLQALAEDPGQQHRSRHHRAFLDPNTTRLLLEENARRLRRNLAAGRVPREGIDHYVSVLGNPPAMEAALAWYRAQAALRAPLGPIAVPTLYIWGDADATVGRFAAEETKTFVAAPYRFAVLPGIGHFASDEAPDAVTDLLLAHLAQHGGA